MLINIVNQIINKTIFINRDDKGKKEIIFHD
jgi:hypothetical protein